MRFLMAWQGILLSTLWVVVPCVTWAGEAAPRMTSGSGSAGLQLAAAIGIVRPEGQPPVTPPPEEPPVIETAPAAPIPEEGNATVESGEDTQAAESDASETEASTVSSKTILIGAGVAALLGVVASGGSSTPSHGQ